jgi:diaminopropionate ammonia-lyase
MTVDDADAVAAMRQLANPTAGDPAIVAGESGGVGLAGLLRAVSVPAIKAALRIDKRARIFLVNTEGATDPGKYEALVGSTPAAVIAKNAM